MVPSTTFAIHLIRTSVMIRHAVAIGSIREHIMITAKVITCVRKAQQVEAFGVET